MVAFLRETGVSPLLSLFSRCTGGEKTLRAKRLKNARGNFDVMPYAARRKSSIFLPMFLPFLGSRRRYKRSWIIFNPLTTL